LALGEGGDRLFKSFFYDSKDDQVPLGEEERWIDVVPRCGDNVTLVFTPSGEPPARGPFTGEVISVQWTFEPSDTPGNPITARWTPPSASCRPESQAPPNQSLHR
jgi:hypothetical protein